MKSVRASLGCLVHGPWSLRHRTLVLGSCSMVHDHRAKGERPSSILKSPGFLVQGPWPSLEGQSPRPAAQRAEVQGPRSQDQRPGSRDPGGPHHAPRSSLHGPCPGVQGNRPTVYCKVRPFELAPQAPGFRRPRDQDATQRTTASTGMLTAHGKVQGPRFNDHAGVRNPLDRGTRSAAWGAVA